jgi:hypothetical protein
MINKNCETRAVLVGAENRVTTSDQRLCRSRPSQSRLAGHPPGSLAVALRLTYLLSAPALAERLSQVRDDLDGRLEVQW